LDRSTSLDIENTYGDGEDGDGEDDDDDEDGNDEGDDMDGDNTTSKTMKTIATWIKNNITISTATIATMFMKIWGDRDDIQEF